ncbi:hypothetical protein DM860_018050 [Cuscuta australis]|uniref:Uncharacterized protein n=1 Tax=Cuscuta australis TaxID=267555 RepID=A0A328DV75_9ASTE|nr:hypothetical protein DM860_018050 [Cuscuta australis]
MMKVKGRDWAAEAEEGCRTPRHGGCRLPPEAKVCPPPQEKPCHGRSRQWEDFLLPWQIQEYQLIFKSKVLKIEREYKCRNGAAAVALWSIDLRSTEEFDFFFKMKNVAVNLAQIETNETLNLSSLLGKVGLCYDTSSSDL